MKVHKLQTMEKKTEHAFDPKDIFRLTGTPIL